MKLIFPFVALLMCSTAQAEVMDKEPSLSVVLVVAAVFAAAGFGAARYKPAILLGIVPLSMLLSYGHISELQDPSVGPAIAREAGTAYVYGSWGGMAAVAVAMLVGHALRSKQGRT